MGELSAAEQQLLEAIAAARESRQAIPSRGEAWGVDLVGAYRVQAALAGANSAQAAPTGRSQGGTPVGPPDPGPGRPLKGYKVGLTSPAKQAQMGVESPIRGVIRAEMLYDGMLPLGRFIQPRLEPEVAAVLRGPIGADAGPGEAWQAVGGFFLGVDILDSIWAGYRFTAVEVVADNASGGAFLLGETPIPPSDLHGGLGLYLDGERIAEGPIDAVGDIGSRIGWLAREIGGLARGQLVFLGSPVPATPARSGLLEVVGFGRYLAARLEG